MKMKTRIIPTLLILSASTNIVLAMQDKPNGQEETAKKAPAQPSAAPSAPEAPLRRLVRLFDELDGCSGEQATAQLLALNTASQECAVTLQNLQARPADPDTTAIITRATILMQRIQTHIIQSINHHEMAGVEIPRAYEVAKSLIKILDHATPRADEQSSYRALIELTRGGRHLIQNGQIPTATRFNAAATSLSRLLNASIDAFYQCSLATRDSAEMLDDLEGLVARDSHPESVRENDLATLANAQTLVDGLDGWMRDHGEFLDNIEDFVRNADVKQYIELIRSKTRKAIAMPKTGEGFGLFLADWLPRSWVRTAAPALGIASEKEIDEFKDNPELVRLLSAIRAKIIEQYGITPEQLQHWLAIAEQYLDGANAWGETGRQRLINILRQTPNALAIAAQYTRSLNRANQEAKHDDQTVVDQLRAFGGHREYEPMHPVTDHSVNLSCTAPAPAAAAGPSGSSNAPMSDEQRKRLVALYNLTKKNGAAKKDATVTSPHSPAPAAPASAPAAASSSAPAPTSPVTTQQRPSVPAPAASSAAPASNTTPGTPHRSGTNDTETNNQPRGDDLV